MQELRSLVDDFDRLRAAEEALKLELKEIILSLVTRFAPRQQDARGRVFLTTKGDYYLMRAFLILGLPDPVAEAELYLHEPDCVEDLPYHGGAV